MDLLFQLLVNGVAVGAAYALLALGLALIWSVTGVFHLAHGGVYVLAGYAIVSAAGLSLWLALPLACAAMALLGMGLDAAIYRPLARCGAKSLTLTTASLAALIFLLNLAAAIWGTEARQVGGLDAVEGFALGPAYVAGTGVAMVVTGAILFGGAMLVLRFTRIGRVLRAVSDDPGMSVVVGVRLGTVRAAAFAIGSALTVPPAYLIGLQDGISPYAGMTAILIASAAVIVGGVGSLAGAGLGALLLAVAQNLGIWKVDSAWQESIAFCVLLLVIVARPTGLMGRRGRVGGV